VATTYNVRTLVTEAQYALNDITGSRMLSDADILRFLLRRVITRNHTVTLYDTGNGYYAYLGGAVFPMILNETTPFSGEDGLTYTVNANGPSAVVTDGSATEDSLSVTGTLVDYEEALADMLVYLATHKAQQVSESFLDGSMTPVQVHRQMMEMAEAIRGPRGA